MRKVMALALAGGNVSGFGVLTRNRAKAALGFSGHYRVCDFALSNITNSGITQAGLLIQYLPGSLMAHVGLGKWYDLEGGERILKIMPPFMGFGETNWFKGTADCIYRNMDFIEGSDAENVLILSCEHIYNIDFREVLASHIERKAAATLVVTRLPKERLTRRFGYPRVDPDTQRVFELQEKPEKPLSDIIFTGIVLFRRDVLVERLIENAKDPKSNNLTVDIITPLVREAPCFAYEHKGYWEYLEDLGAYYDVQMAMTRGQSQIRPGEWNVHTNLAYRGFGGLPPAMFGPKSEISDSLISPGAKIDGIVRRSVISPCVTVEEGAVVEDSIIMHHCLVGAGARLQRVISDKDAIFGAQSQIGGGPEVPAGINSQLPKEHRQLVVVGKAARIAPGLRVEPAVQFYPGVDTEAMHLREVASGGNVVGDKFCWPDTDLGFLPRKAS